MLEFIEMILRRVQSSPWQPLYLMVIGFLLIPLFHWSRYDDGSGTRLILVLLLVLGGLRVLPAILRKVVPFSSDLQAQWFSRRRIAKRYDSYQWRKLLWIGVGLALYIVLFQRQGGVASVVAAACVVTGGLGAVAWRRVASLEPLKSDPALT